jgi:hypothetical protein
MDWWSLENAWLQMMISMKEMQSNTPQNEWVQYTFQPQSVVLNHRDQDKIGTFGCNHNQMSQKACQVTPKT